MKEMLGKGLQFIFVIGFALCINSVFEKTNYNTYFSMALCIFTAHWIKDTFIKIVEEVKDE